MMTPDAVDAPIADDNVESDDIQFNAAIDKTEKGFGIYFAKVNTFAQGDHLIVDGFVECDGNEDPALSALRLGDILVGVNGADCREKEVVDILDLLRSAETGPNTLSFVRHASINVESESGASDTQEAKKKSTGRFMGAFMKVKSKIQAEIDGGEDELRREQLEDERFEKQWLEEFEGLKQQYETKWETCTYTADEFCGLIYRSSDVQQKECLLGQYPTLMEAWKNPRGTTSSSRVIPEWPAAKVSYEDPITEVSDETGAAKLRSIHCSQSLQQVLEILHKEFMWRPVAVQAFSRKLESCGISSCAALLETMDESCGSFERDFLSVDYPRLSKRIVQTLHSNAQQAEESSNVNEPIPSMILTQVNSTRATAWSSPITKRFTRR